MGYRLLALDVDGTLLDSAGVLQPRVRQAVRAAADAGCVVAIATGRRYHAAVAIAEALGLDAPLILHNGAVVQRAQSGEVLAEAPLPLPAAHAAAGIMAASGAQVVAFPPPRLGDVVIAGPADLDGELAALYLADCGLRVCRRPLDDLFEGVGPLTMVAMDSETRLDGVAAALATRADCRVTRNTFPLWGRRFHVLDVLAPETSKAAAVAALAARLGVPLAATVAIGDHFNDVEMLETVGLGIAMGNAPAEVRARAARVTGTCDEAGVAQALEALPFGPA
ncbi:MAG TPA: HAD hydrolase family protein [Chloroflexota bacterium]|nr:HAD hydrolase family protein [Chloroflexota bacterium]